jgi:hypothetical protein
LHWFNAAAASRHRTRLIKSDEKCRLTRKTNKEKKKKQKKKKKEKEKQEEKRWMILRESV